MAKKRHLIGRCLFLENDLCLKFEPKQMDAVKGTVRSIGDESIEVVVLQRSACSECHARGACTSADARERLISVKNYPLGIKVGDTVQLVAKEGMTMKAVLLAFVLPLALILIVALVLTGQGVEDLTIAVALIVLLIVYGGILYMCRGYIEKELVFWAERIEETLD